MVKVRKSPFIFLLAISGVLLTLLYIIIRVYYFFIADYAWDNKIIAFLLLFAEAFVLIHGLNYLSEILTVLFFRESLSSTDRGNLKNTTSPNVAVVVASYHEPLDIIEETLTCLRNLTYKNKTVILLDDTRYDQDDPMDDYRNKVEKLCKSKKVDLFRRKWRGAKAGIINDLVSFLNGDKNSDFNFYNYSDTQDLPKRPDFLVVFDADQNPMPSFIEPLIARMEKDDKLAFIQTPQYYTNTQKNPVARASSFQQHVFYEYICEGKGFKNAMFCCGTNVIFRMDAFVQVGGFREDSITEDFATSMNFFSNGWRSEYFNRPSAFGMAPEDLGGYFKQQFRWALGTVGLLPEILSRMIKNPRQFRFSVWWEFLISSTYYYIGFAYLILILCPIIYIFFSVPTFFIDLKLYSIVFFPYILVTLSIFFSTLIKREYKIKDIFLGQLLSILTFPVYIKATFFATIGKKGRFVVTPKKGSSVLQIKDIFPQFLFISLNLIAFVWGINRLIYEDTQIFAIIISLFWCFYHFSLLSSIFYFNRDNRYDN